MEDLAREKQASVNVSRRKYATGTLRLPYALIHTQKGRGEREGAIRGLNIAQYINIREKKYVHRTKWCCN